MKSLFYVTLCLFISTCCVLHATENFFVQTESSFISIENEAKALFQYFLNEVKNDENLSHEEQHDKILEFKALVDDLSPETAAYLTHLLIDETRGRITEMLQTAGLDGTEIEGFLAGYEEAISRVRHLDVEIAREMLFFVAELKIHRKYVYDFGVILGCPTKQLLRHDLCKLEVEQFEGYARYFRGGRQKEDKSAYLEAWAHHQYEEHHHQSYSKEGFSFDNFTEEHLQNNMLETVADLLAANKQRGGGTLINYLVNIFPKQNPHPRLLPYIEDALKKAHAFYLESGNDQRFSLFQGLPSWNNDVQEVFHNLRNIKT